MAPREKGLLLAIGGAGCGLEEGLEGKRGLLILNGAWGMEGAKGAGCGKFKVCKGGNGAWAANDDEEEEDDDDDDCVAEPKDKLLEELTAAVEAAGCINGATGVKLNRGKGGIDEAAVGSKTVLALAAFVLTLALVLRGFLRSNRGDTEYESTILAMSNTSMKTPLRDRKMCCTAWNTRCPPKSHTENVSDRASSLEMGVERDTDDEADTTTAGEGAGAGAGAARTAFTPVVESS